MLNQKQFGCLKFLFVKHNWKFKKQNFFQDIGFYGPLEKRILKNSEKRILKSHIIIQNLACDICALQCLPNQPIAILN
jgi:hypothetical protein